MSTLTLVSHAGSSHSDDLLSTAFLKKYFEKKYDNIICVRTSDLSPYYTDETEPLENEITTTKGGSHSIIYDTGRGLFDHHQKDARVRVNGIKFCAFGLLWERFGLDFLREKYGEDCDFNILDAFDIFERDFVMGIDAHDNGQKADGVPNFISGLLARMRPNWDSDKATAWKYFQTANEISEKVFDMEIEKAVSAAKAIPIVRIATDYALEKNIKYCVFSQLVPYQQIILDDERLNHILYAIYPSNHVKGEWSVAALPVRMGDFQTRKPLPKSLRGLPRAQLMPKNWVFVHATGFMGAAVSLEDAIKLAEYGISEPEDADDGDILGMGEWPVKDKKFSNEEFRDLKIKFQQCVFGSSGFEFSDNTKERIMIYAYSFSSSVTDGNLGVILDPDHKYDIYIRYQNGRDMGYWGHITKKRD